MKTYLFKCLNTVTISFCLIFVTANVPSSFADSGYSDMVVFGDSLSDPGNAFVLSGELSLRPYVASGIPDGPYPIGKGKTFSNGPTWSQLVAKELHLHGGTGPALRTTSFTNYAFGGARASATKGGPFDMDAQVNQYLADNGASDPDALYAIWFGGNDIRDALVAFITGGPEAATVAITDAISGYAANMVTLISSGATDFLVLNAPNVGTPPAVTTLGPEASGLATYLSFVFNEELYKVLDSLEVGFGVSIIRFDAFTLITATATFPEVFGLVNGTDSCLTPLVTAGAICKSPDDYVFWDGLHPTRATHEIIANAVLSAMP